jgi:hypothetical protein
LPSMHKARVPSPAPAKTQAGPKPRSHPCPPTPRTSMRPPHCPKLHEESCGYRQQNSSHDKFRRKLRKTISNLIPHTLQHRGCRTAGDPGPWRNGPISDWDCLRHYHSPSSSALGGAITPPQAHCLPQGCSHPNAAKGTVHWDRKSLPAPLLPSSFEPILTSKFLWLEG